MFEVSMTGYCSSSEFWVADIVGKILGGDVQFRHFEHTRFALP
jgi:hypothetical protein